MTYTGQNMSKNIQPAKSSEIIIITTITIT